MAKPKVLLIAQADMNQIIEQNGSEVIYDDIYKKYFNAYNAYFDAPVLAAKRVFFNNQTTASSSALTAAFSKIANDGAGSTDWRKRWTGPSSRNADRLERGVWWRGFGDADGRRGSRPVIGDRLRVSDVGSRSQRGRRSNIGND